MIEVFVLDRGDEVSKTYEAWKSLVLMDSLLFEVYH